MRSRKTRRIATAAVLAAAGAVVIPQAASAAVVSASGGLATYQAAPGEVNQVMPFVENGALKIREINAATPLTAGAGCVITATRIATCSTASQARINLGDRDDTYYGTGAGFTPTAVNGDAGDDTLIDGDGALKREVYSGGAGEDTAAYFLAGASVSLTLDNAANDGQSGENDLIAGDVENLTGSQQNDTLVGNAAGNHLRGQGGNDYEAGLDGDDYFEEGTAPNGADVMTGGGGIDRVLYRERTNAGVRVSFDGAANDGATGEGDNTLADVENVTATPFADVLTGSAAANTIAGLGGNDTINPLGGSDVVFGGDGNDSINVRDGVRDVANGNAGTDTFTRDAIDVVGA